MSEIKIPLDDFLDLVVIESASEGTMRWSYVEYRIVKYKEKYWRGWLHIPATESNGDIQDINASEIELTEVRKVSRMVERWEHFYE